MHFGPPTSLFLHFLVLSQVTPHPLYRLFPLSDLSRPTMFGPTPVCVAFFLDMPSSRGLAQRRCCLPPGSNYDSVAGLEEDALAQELLCELLCSDVSVSSCELASTQVLKEQQEAAFDQISAELRHSGSLRCSPSPAAGATLALPACASSAPSACH
ncbi:hypothetical protein ABPG75_003469 [Micractinium tetrahymenae]